MGEPGPRTATTAEPLPVRRVTMAPARRSRSHSEQKSDRLFPNTFSKVFPRRIRDAALSRLRPRIWDDLMLTPRGVKAHFPRSIRAYGAPAATRQPGIAIMARHGA